MVSSTKIILIIREIKITVKASSFKFLIAILISLLFLLPMIQSLGVSNLKSTPESAPQGHNLEKINTVEPNYEQFYSNNADSRRDIPENFRAESNDYALSFDPLTQYLIILPESFLASIEPLASWKHQKGVYTTIATIDGPNGINSTYIGVDLQAKIQAYLRDFNSSAPNLKWLLLVGDSEVIPTREIKMNNTNSSALLDNFCSSDYYYSALGTTWDTNNNQIYGESGEEDWTPDLYVGRLPVNNNTELKNTVNKILTYEKSPPAGDWYQRTIQCGALMDRPNELDDLSTFEDEGYNDYKDNAYEVILKICDYLPAYMENLTFLDYDRINGLEYARINDTLNESAVLTAFNLGASTVNFASKGDDNGVKHYSGSGLGRIEYNSEYYFNHETAKKTTNAYKLPLVYSSSCTSGNFTEEDDTNLEYLITAPTGGAIGFIGATVETYRLEFIENDTSYGNWWLDAEFWRKFFTGEGQFRPGEILYRLKEDYYKHFTDTDNDTENNPHPEDLYQPLYRVNFFAYNLLGDPEVPIYTSTPTKLTVQHPKIIHPISHEYPLTIKVFDSINNKPVKDADVCLIGKESYMVQTTDINGVARFELVIDEEEILKLTVTAHNHYYYESNITIEVREDLVVHEENIIFDRNPIPPRATVNISIEVKNNGSSELTGIRVNCYADYIDTINPGVILAQDLIIDSISPGTRKIVNLNWTASNGSHTITAVVDVNDEIFEFNESNNIATTMLIENKPPTIFNLPNKKIKEDMPVVDAIDLNDFVWDEDTNELQFYITDISNPDFNITLNASKLSFNPPPNWYGNVTVMVSVYDGTSYDEDEFIIIVDPVNDPPIINETIDWIIQDENITVASDYIAVLEDTLVQIMVVGHDYLDNDTEFIYSSDSPLFEINSSSGEFWFIPSNEDVGVYTINFTLDDGHEENNLAWHQVTFEVINTNDPPELDFISKHFLIVGDTFELWVEGSDIDKFDKLEYRDNSKFFDINSTTGQILFKVKDENVGRHEIIIVVSDGNVTKSKNLILEIESAPDEPLDNFYLLLCPSILIIIIIFLFAQEYLRNRSKKGNNKLKKE